MNRREMLGASIIPFVGLPVGLIDANMVTPEKTELDKKKQELAKLCQEIYGMEIDTTIAGSIRLWKLGHIGHDIATTIIPSKSAIEKLRKIIEQAPKDGKFDIIWGPELDVKVI
jgi:hypothetical protein